MGNEVSEKVIRKVARKKDMQPAELEPLYTAINPDALNEIFNSDEQSGTVVFPYMNYDVMVTSSGTVTIE